MNLRWLWFDHIPAHLLLPQRECAKIRRRANTLREELGNHPANQRARWLGWLLYLPNLALLIALLGGRFSSKYNPPISLKQVLMIVFIWDWISTAFLRSRTHAPFVYLALREFGHDVCPGCGYDLRKLPSTVTQCPECGVGREPMRKRRLEAPDLANPAIVQAMHDLGYTVCRGCGLMILDSSTVIASDCPECGTKRESTDQPKTKHST